MLNTVFPPWPSFTQEEADAVSRVILSNKVNYWTGQECREFEKEFAVWTGSKYAIALANGTLALDAALRALGIGSGDEVIVTPRTFIASASCIVSMGAVPVFADVDRNTQNITAETITNVLSPRTKAVICVHLAGMPCDMDPIMDLAQRQGIYVIEDCAQAHGARYKGRSVGSIGHIGAWSFCQGEAVGVYYVQGSTARGSIGDGFLDTGHAKTAGMGENDGFLFGGIAVHLENFTWPRTRVIPHGNPDAQSTRLEFVLHGRAERFHLMVFQGHIVGAGEVDAQFGKLKAFEAFFAYYFLSLREIMAIRSHGHGPQRAMWDGRSIVDDGLALLACQPLPQEKYAGFEFQSCRHPIMCLIFMGFIGHAVGVQINEARGHYEPRSVDLLRAFESRGADFYDAVAAYADIAHSVQARFGVYDAPAADHQVIKHRLGKREVCRQKKEGKDGFAHSLVVFNTSVLGRSYFLFRAAAGGRKSISFRD